MRLIPPAPPGTTLDALRALLAYRLPSGADAEQAAREEWRTIVEGRSHLWAGIPEDRKETIRGMGHGRLFLYATLGLLLTRHRFSGVF